MQSFQGYPNLPGLVPSYAANEANDIPAPQLPALPPSQPPLFPSLNTPQLAPPPPFPNSNLGQARFAHGGAVHPNHMRHMAHELEHEGQDGDSVLAHINPMEAQLLDRLYGHDINPITGLPQYFKLGRLFKKLLPVGGALLGNLIAPGIGGVIGGGLGGLAGKGKKGILPGLGIGAGLGLFGPALGGAMGAQQGGMLYNALGGGNALGNAVGLGGMFGGAGAGAGAAGAGGAAAGGGLGGLLGGGGALGNILPALAFAGMAFGKRKIPKEPGIEQIAEQHRPKWKAEDQPRNVRPFMRERETRFLPDEGEYRYYRPYSLGVQYYADGGEVEHEDPAVMEALARDYLEGNGEEDRPIPEYAHGGHSRYFEGATDGQADKIPAMLSDGEYVIDASTVSDLGDGNNKAGALKLKRLVENVRIHKRKGGRGLPPKAKSLASYMHQRGRAA